jgi:hypothetical protein
MAGLVAQLAVPGQADAARARAGGPVTFRGYPECILSTFSEKTFRHISQATIFRITQLSP